MKNLTYTVFTPTYNRAHLLPVLFNSLCQQTFQDFEWLIVDDGSHDNTNQIVEDFRQTARFTIRYATQHHGGKHKAINLGVQLAHGLLFGIADSDDYYTDNALESCFRHHEQIAETERTRFAGVTGLCVTQTGQLIGSPFPRQVFDSDALMLVAKRIGGDKAGFIRTDVMKQFPFPEDLGTFVPEALIWNRIAAHYKTRYFNEVIMVRDYQLDGLSARIAQVRIEAPEASCRYYLELLHSKQPLPVDVAVRYCSNYVRFSLHKTLGLKAQLACVPSTTLFLAAAPLGFALYCRDKYQSKNVRSHSQQHSSA